MELASRWSAILILSVVVACGGDGRDPDSGDGDVGGGDSSVDGGGSDSGDDAGTDGGTDGGGEDAGDDAGDAGEDAGDDAGEDAGDDAGEDAGEDAGPDGGVGCDPGSSCGEERFCDYTPNTCGAEEGSGVCTARPDLCREDCPGVCGCDGRRYCNSCLAAASGIDVDPEGDCTEFSACDEMDARGIGFCEILVGYAFNGSRCTEIICECEGRDCDRIYRDLESCEETTAECRGETCGGIAGLLCEEDSFCETDGCPAFPDAAGTCTEVPESCEDTFPGEVCGCDGITYRNRCEAQRARVSVASAGACGAGRACGGFGGDPCDDGDFCNYAPGDFCGFADAPGRCTRRPPECGEPPPGGNVCGCDGRDYPSECEAARAATGILNRGNCED